MFTDSVGWIVCLLSASADLALADVFSLDISQAHYVRHLLYFSQKMHS